VQAADQRVCRGPTAAPVPVTAPPLRRRSRPWPPSPTPGPPGSSPPPPVSGPAPAWRGWPPSSSTPLATADPITGFERVAGRGHGTNESLTSRAYRSTVRRNSEVPPDGGTRFTTRGLLSVDVDP